MNPKSRKLFKLIVNVLVMMGFTYQVWEICGEYFKYPTVTSVTFVDALDSTNIPQVALCVAWNHNRHKSPDEEFQEQLMDKPPDGSHPGGDPTMRTDIMYSPLNRYSKTRHRIKLTQFLVRDQICLSVKSRSPTNILPDVLKRFLTYPIFSAHIKVKTPFSGMYGSTTLNFNIIMTSYNSDFDSPIRGILVGNTKTYFKTFLVAMSYSQRVTQLSPPPYDTNCRDYWKDGLVSKDSCVKKCINNFTEPHHFIFYDHVIDRDKHLIRANTTKDQRSFLRPLNSYVKDYAAGSTPRLRLPRWLKNPTYPEVLVKNLPKVYDNCKRHCHQSDCETEYIMPSVTNIDKGGHGNLSDIDIMVTPAKEPVIVVTSKGKLLLLDFVVYVLSCLSFWFGFCPLSVSTTSYRHIDNRVLKFVRPKLAIYHSYMNRNFDNFRRDVQPSLRATRVVPITQNR